MTGEVVVHTIAPIEGGFTADHLLKTHIYRDIMIPSAIALFRTDVGDAIGCLRFGLRGTLDVVAIERIMEDISVVRAIRVPLFLWKREPEVHSITVRDVPFRTTMLGPTNGLVQKETAVAQLSGSPMANAAQ